MKSSDVARKNLNTLAAGLRSQLSSVLTTVGFLQSQVTMNESTPPDFTSYSKFLNSPSDDVDTSIVRDPQWDTSVEFTTSATGQVFYQAGGYLYISTFNFAWAEAGFGVEIYRGATLAPEDLVFVSPMGGGTLQISDADLTTQLTVMGHPHLVTLDPNTLYTARTYRRFSLGYRDIVGGSQWAGVGWQGSSLTITKKGK